MQNIFMPEGRYLSSVIQEDLVEKMVFIAGPRQVGKTTLAHMVAQTFPSFAYFSWDRLDDRKHVMRAQWPSDSTVLIFDELHKYRRWKRWIKGEYDRYQGLHRFLVTGSARMDVYRRGGDSLQGRYHHFRLHPFSVAEISHTTKRSYEPFAALPCEAKSGAQEMVSALLQFGGFPEPILKQSTRAFRRWQKERLERLFREDIRDLTSVRDLSLMQTMLQMLYGRAANILSLNTIRQDLEISHRAVAHWLDILEYLYVIYRLRPFHVRRIASLRKQPKLFFWDWSVVGEPGARFENMVASHLLKFCHFLEDTEGYPVELWYLRDAQKREVDFLVTMEGKPWFAVEAKQSDTTPSASLSYFGQKLSIPFLYQVVHDTSQDVMSRTDPPIRILPAHIFLSALC